MSATCSNPSQRTSTEEQDVPPPPSNKKYSIIVDLDGAKGRDATKWSSRCGVLIRCYIPVGYEEWRKVDNFYKDNLWTALMKEFEMNVDSKVARPILEKKFPQYFRTVKSKLRKRYLKKDGELIPRRVALDNRPDDIDKIWWGKFIDIEYSDRKKEQCKTNTENKAKNSITHTLGRKSYLKLYEELAAENPEEKPTRAKAWKMVHKNRKTGEVLPCAAEKFALIEAAEERQKAEASLNGDGIKSLADFETDPIAEVFGDDKGKSYCRAISSSSTTKQVKLTQISKAIGNSLVNEDMRELKREIQSQHNEVKEVKEGLKTMCSSMLSMQQCMQQFMSQLGGNVTVRTEVASNVEHTPNSHAASLGIPSNGGIGSTTREKQSVMLLSRDLKEVVAKGYLGKQRICHHREVVEGEKVVWVDEVIDPNAPIFEAPQDGNYTLVDIVDGGFVIWPEYRLRYM